MKKRYSEEQIIRAIKEHEAGAKVDDLCRQLGISSRTFYNWRSKYAGMEVNEAKRLRELESENAKLKKLLAEKLLEKAGAASPCYGQANCCKSTMVDGFCFRSVGDRTPLSILSNPVSRRRMHLWKV